ncbi:MAG TPA: ABC transporter substrate-binding protein, partial [Acidimicrobiia bacterium]|nr:ABC transporter substrate-binding protein [Acidimicrobiia bacterium]
GGAGSERRAYPPGVSDSTIRIGGSTFTSGPAAVYGEQIAVGFAAGIDYVNDHGGINGRKVELILYDDGADPAKQLANTKRLVEVDDVFALAMVYAPAVGDYVASKGIPVFHLGQFDEEFTNPWWFSVGAPQRLASYWMADFGVNRLEAKSVAVFYLDAGTANYSRAYAESVAADWKGYGAEVPVLAPFAPDQTSCSDALSQAREAEVDFIQFEIDAAKVINCGVEAQLQGYKPPKGWGGYLIGVPVIYEALGDFSKGMYAFDAFGALYDFPDYAKYISKVSSSTEARSSTTISYFVAALLMRDALERLGDDLTRQGVRDVLNTFSGWQPGLTSHPNQPSWTWTPTCHVALRGGYVIQIQEQADGNLRWVQISDQLPRTPIPPGTEPPPRYASCDIFTHQSAFRSGP